MTFSFFSPLHFGFLAMVVGLGVGFGIYARRHPGRRGAILRTGAVLVVALELAWYTYLLYRPFPIWPGILPLHLCDVVLWLTVVSALAPLQKVRELAYYYGLAGTSMALIMPDVQGLRISYPVIQFFVSHGLVVALLLVLVLSREFRPGKGSLLRAVVVLHAYAALLGAFNYAFGANYMYLCSRPGSDSILHLMGTWPWYLVGADIVGIGMFTLLWLPFRHTTTEQ